MASLCNARVLSTLGGPLGESRGSQSRSCAPGTSKVSTTSRPPNCLILWFGLRDVYRGVQEMVCSLRKKPAHRWWCARCTPEAVMGSPHHAARHRGTRGIFSGQHQHLHPANTKHIHLNPKPHLNSSQLGRRRPSLLHGFPVVALPAIRRSRGSRGRALPAPLPCGGKLPE